MDLTAAALVAMILSFVVYATMAAWYVVPRLRDLPVPVALVPLLWIHAFRPERDGPVHGAVGRGGVREGRVRVGAVGPLDGRLIRSRS